MHPVNGLYGHIQKNTMKSALLLAGFVVLILLFWYAWCVIYTVIFDELIPSYVANRTHGFVAKRVDGHSVISPIISGHAHNSHSVAMLLAKSLDRALDRWMIPLIIASGWLTIAYLVHSDLIRMATGARPVSRTDQPRLYKLVERVAISAGLPMPRVEIMNSGALNAYAAGLGPNDAVVVVTWGLLNTLNDDELEAVIAHEITHIKNYDVRLMVVATVFAGGLTMLGEAVAGWASSGAPGAETGAAALLKSGATVAASEGGNPGRSTAILVSLAMAIIFLALTHLFAILIRFAISRSREYMADAGAVELTKNPDALICALRRISENDDVPGLGSTAQAMMISSSLGGLFSTHPAIADRIAALQKYAGGRASAPRPRPARATGGLVPGAAAPLPAGAVGFGRRRATPLARR